MTSSVNVDLLFKKKNYFLHFLCEVSGFFERKTFSFINSCTIIYYSSKFHVPQLCEELFYLFIEICTYNWSHQVM